MTFGVTYKVKSNFFDRKRVQRELGKNNAAALSKFGAFVRRRARSSMRRRKKASTPGTPPSAHSTDAIATLKNILFAYDDQRKSVVIGPVLLDGSQGSIPALHEFGGQKTIIERRRGRRAQRGQPPVKRTVIYPPRPFMGPARDEELPNFPRLVARTALGMFA